MTQDQADILHLLADVSKEVSELKNAFEGMRTEMKPIVEAYSGGKWAFSAISIFAKFIVGTAGTASALYGIWLFIKHQINT